MLLRVILGLELLPTPPFEPALRAPKGFASEVEAKPFIANTVIPGLQQRRGNHGNTAVGTEIWEMRGLETLLEANSDESKRYERKASVFTTT